MSLSHGVDGKKARHVTDQRRQSNASYPRESSFPIRAEELEGAVSGLPRDAYLWSKSLITEETVARELGVIQREVSA